MVGVTVLTLGAGLLFLPFLFVAPLAPVVMIGRQRSRRRRWLRLLPVERDHEPVQLT